MNAVDNNLVLSLSADVEIVRERDGVFIKQIKTLKYLYLDNDDLEILLTFDGKKNLGEVLYSLLQRPQKPSIRKFYDLVLTAQNYGLLVQADNCKSLTQEFDPWKEENYKTVRPSLSSYLFSLILAIISALTLIFYIIPNELDKSEDAYFWIFVAIGVSIGLSLSSILMAINLKLWNRVPYRFRISFARIIPYLEVDTKDAFMGGRICESITSFVGVLGPIIWGSIIWVLSYLFRPYETPEGKFIVPFRYFGALHLSVWIGILIESSPFGATSMQQLIHALFRKHHDIPKHASHYLKSKFLGHLLRWHDELSEEKYFIAYSTYVIIWLYFTIDLGIKFVAAQYAQAISNFLIEETLGPRFYLVFGIVIIGFILLLIPILYILWVFGFGIVKEVLKRFSSKEGRWKKAKASGKVPDQEQLISFLKENILFSDLPRERIIDLIPYFKLIHVKKGQTLIREGDDGDLLFIIWAGEVNVIKETESGQQKVLATLSRGDIFGEIALLNNVKRTTSVVATTPVDCLILKRDDFQREIVSRLGAQTVAEKIQRAGFFRRTELFSDWNPKAIVALTSRCKLQEFNDQDILIHEGQENKNFYLLYEGKLDVYKNKKHIATLEPGKFCGEISLLKNIPATADVKANGKVKCFVFDKETFLEIVTKDFFTGYLLDEELEKRLACSI
ncbi:MAG: cyclic nucleotide-binding domain-containing protein [Verrucomicrobiae bacterium]|nr:cyclic nucleotide-binding domain-containing protein [Verrucomicrobiae bacterium]